MQKPKVAITFTIDGKTVAVEKGKTVLEAAKSAGIKIPTLCWHEQLSTYGACRLCLVEVVAGGKKGLHASCQFVATEGLEVRTNSEKVEKTRKIMFELLLARCPSAEKIKALAAEYGITETRIRLPKTSNCILCGLCVRACAEVSQRHAINFAYRGAKRVVQTPFNKVSDMCIGCGACAHVCPTGAIQIEQVD